MALPVLEGSTIIHDFVASGTIAEPSSVKPSQRCRTHQAILSVSEVGDQAILANGPSRHREPPMVSNPTTRCFVPFFPACHGTVDRVNHLVVAPSIINRLLRSPVDTITAPSDVMVGRSREHRGQGTDRCESRFAPGSAKTVRGRPLEISRGIHRVLSPHVAVRPHRFSSGSRDDSTRVDTRAARKPWGTGSHRRAPYTSHHELLARSRYYAGKGRTSPYVSQAPGCLRAPKPRR